MVYLVPSLLAEDALETIPAYILNAIKDCQVIFAENERTARRFLKSMQREMVIDDFEWHSIHKAEKEQLAIFKQKIKEGKNIGIISEAGCPGVADPGQLLVAEAQKMDVAVKPLVGPSSILLALMASGLNGQHFSFHGYLPIEHASRIKKIKELEKESSLKKCTQIFIETPYRNDQLLKDILHNCDAYTKLCIASEITSSNEWIKTRNVSDWTNQIPALHKKPVIFLLQA